MTPTHETDVCCYHQRMTGHMSNYQKTDNLTTRISLHDRFSINPVGWHRWVAGQLGLQPGHQVLELGCGVGTLWEAVGKRPEGLRLLLTDRSQAMLDTVAHRVSGAQVELVDADDIRLPSAAFDLVVANHMLYHVADPSATLRSIHRLLKPGGRAVLTTNGNANLKQIVDLLVARSAATEATGLTARFGLETGYRLVKEVFGAAEVARYSDALHVTEVEPVLDYVRSLPGDLSEVALEEIRTTIAGHISEYGALFVMKDVGMITTAVVL